MILTILRVLYLRLRNNPLELLLVFVMPVVFFSVFATIFSNGIATGSDKKLRVCLIGGRDTQLGSQLYGFLEQNPSLLCTRVSSPGDPRGLGVSSDWTGKGAEETKRVQANAMIQPRIQELQQSGLYDVLVRLPAGSPCHLANPSEEAVDPVCEVVLVTDGQNPMAVSMVTSIVKGFFAQQTATRAADQLLKLRTSLEGAGGVPVLQNVGERVTQPVHAEGGAARYASAAIQPTNAFFNERYDAWVQKEWDWEGTDVGWTGLLSRTGDEQVLPLGSTAPIEPTTVDRSSNSSGLQTTAVAEASGPETDGPVNVTVENPLAATQQNPRVAMYAAGIAVLFLLFSATGHAAALLEEAESGTLDRILVSKAGLLHIVCGKWLGIVLLGCLQITVMFLWADVAFKIQLAKHLQGFCVMTVSTAAATASFAMLLATLCKTRSQLNAVSVMVILCMSAVGGSMIPRFAMSDRMKEIGTWTFNAWALDGYQKVFWYQQPLSSLQPEVTVLLGSAAVLGTLTLVLSGRWKRG